MKVSQVLVIIGIGGLIGGFAAVSADYAKHGRFSIDTFAVGAMYGSAFALLAIASPIAAAGLALWGAYSTMSLTKEVFDNPNATWEQKGTALALMVASISGVGLAGNYAGTTMASGARINSGARFPQIESLILNPSFRVMVQQSAVPRVLTTVTASWIGVLRNYAFLRRQQIRSELTGGQRGPMVAQVLDTITGRVFEGLNTETPGPIHPALLARGVGPSNRLHGEINALNKALWARGESARIDNTFILANTRFSNNPNLPIFMARCPMCRNQTNGVMMAHDE
jgi:hypothetical protein